VKPISWQGAVAATIAVAMGGVLLAILAAEDDGSLFGAVVIGVAATAAIAGSVATRPVLRIAFLWTATGILSGIGTLGIFSIGLPLLVAAVFAASGTFEPARAIGRGWVTGAVALTVPAAGYLAVALYVLANN
jgi:hypothetical protein